MYIEDQDEGGGFPIWIAMSQKIKIKMVVGSQYNHATWIIVLKRRMSWTLMDSAILLAN